VKSVEVKPADRRTRDASAEGRLAAPPVAVLRSDGEEAGAAGHRDAWLAAGLADRGVRRDLVKYCRTKFDAKELTRATNRLAEFTGQALVLWSKNPVMPAEHSERLAALLPRGRLRHIDDAYVLVMLDQPERTPKRSVSFCATAPKAAFSFSRKNASEPLQNADFGADAQSSSSSARTSSGMSTLV